MAKKGKVKNSVNKAKHSKLIQQKTNKIKLQKIQHKKRLKVIIKNHQVNKLTD